MAAAPANAQWIAFTFDDGLNPDITPQAAQWNAQILDALAAGKVTAMLFPSLRHVGGEAGRALVAQWSQAGHTVGNHTSAHRNLGAARVNLQDVIEDVQQADAAFKHLPTWQPMLRFPYLKEGETQATRDGMRKWLRENGYRSAPVSVDTSDWAYNRVFLELHKAGDQARLAKLKTLYVDHLLDRATFYDNLASKVLQRQPKHVMLLHVNAINAQWFGDVITAFRKQGWQIVSAQEAFADALYAKEPNILPAGESIVWALAKEAGVTGLRYPAEDAVYEAPRLRAEGLVPAEP
ncbi:MAG: polysaccharide deacetylase family protein [Burkholderiaceae bacterium]